MAYICTKNGACQDCGDYRMDDDKGRMACFAGQKEDKHPMRSFFPMGGPTKTGEYLRTIEMLTHMTHAEKRDIMFALYLMADMGYGNKDLHVMAKIIDDDIKRRDRLHATELDEAAAK